MFSQQDRVFGEYSPMAAIVISCGASPLMRECEEIHRACKGIGADEGKLIEILAAKSAQQRREIRETYRAMYNEDLCRRLERELHGNLEKAIVLWLHEPADRDAMIVQGALERWCTDDRALIEVICTRKSTEIVKIRDAYLQRYQRYLEDDIACKTKGAFQKLLLALVKAHRCECKGVDMDRAKCDAKRLYEAGGVGCGIDEGAIIKMLSETSVPQLGATFACYKELYGQEIMKALKKGTQGEFQEALRVMIKSMYVPAKYFAKILHRGMKGLFNDEWAIARVMVTRAEVDMDEIKIVFESKYGTCLEEIFRKELCGHFKNFCLSLAARGGLCKQLQTSCN